MMKVYAVGPLEDGDEFFPTKKAAIEQAKFYGQEYVRVTEYEIGRLNKATACRLASHRGFAKSYRQVWPLTTS